MQDVDALPPECAIDRESFLHYGIRADLVFPFIVGGQLCGGIGFASSRPRQWPDNVVRGLGLIADVYANVLERKRNLQALQWKEEQMRSGRRVGRHRSLGLEYSAGYDLGYRQGTRDLRCAV